MTPERRKEIEDYLIDGGDAIDRELLAEIDRLEKKVFSENLSQAVQGLKEVFPISDFNTHRLWSLWDIMNKFAMPEFCGCFFVLMKIETQIKKKIEEHRAETVLTIRGLQTADKDIDSDLLKSVQEALDSMLTRCQEIGLVENPEKAFDEAFGKIAKTKPPPKRSSTKKQML